MSSKQYNKIFHESKSFRKEMVFDSVLIDADLAQELIDINTGNRPVKNGLVIQYAETMKKKLWVFNGDVIRISKTAALLDGQHRLLAIIRSKEPQKFNIQTGLEDVSFETMDIGRVRTGGDALAVKGFKNYSQLSGTIKALINWGESGMVDAYANPKKLTNHDIIAFTQDPKVNINLLEACVTRGNAMYWRFKPMSSHTYAMFLYLFSENNNQDKAWHFFDLLTSGENVGKDSYSSVYVLRNKLISDMSNNKSKMLQQVKFALIVKAWNFYLKDRQVAQLVYLETEPFPKILHK